MQFPDIQSKVTDFMIAIAKSMKIAFRIGPAWLFDWDALWKGFASISYCSMHMISPELYRKHALSRDSMFFDNVGDGRIHAAGKWPKNRNLVINTSASTTD